MTVQLSTCLHNQERKVALWRRSRPESTQTSLSPPPGDSYWPLRDENKKILSSYWFELSAFGRAPPLFSVRLHESRSGQSEEQSVGRCGQTQEPRHFTAIMKFVRFIMKNAALASVPKHIEHFSKFSPSPLSMKQFLDFGEYGSAIRWVIFWYNRGGNQVEKDYSSCYWKLM